MNVFFSFVLVFSFIPSAAFAAPSSQGGDTQDGTQTQQAIDDEATQVSDEVTAQEGEESEAAAAMEDEPAAGDEAVAAEDDQPFSGGSGTEDDPYLISTADDMLELATTTNASREEQVYKDTYFKMTADIDLKSVCYEVDGSTTNDVSWTPIGTQVFDSTISTQVGAFGGHFDGDYHRIENLYINSSSSYVGLFGYVSNGSIENLTASGDVCNTKFNNCYTGGVVGYFEGPASRGSARISNVSSEVDVSGSQYVGGIAAWVSDASIVEGCANHGSITLNYFGYAGGIVGITKKVSSNLCDDLIIRNCCNDGHLSLVNKQSGSYQALGGIIGIDGCKDNTTSYQQLYNCYDAGIYSADLTGRGGGVIGGNGGGTFNQAYGNYYLEGNPTTTDSIQENVGAKKMTSEQMKTPAFASMMGDAFGHVDGSYPALRWEGTSGAPQIVSQPVGADYVSGTTPVKLAVEASAPAEGTGFGGELSYQWYSSASGSYFDAKAIDGATGAELALQSAEAGETWYFCEVTNTFGNDASKTCTDIVRVYFADAIATVPQVEGPAAGQSVSYGDEISALEATVKNADDLDEVTYQWYCSTDDDGSDAVAISGATDASYTPSNSETGSWYYYCTVTNTFQGTSVATASTTPVQVSVSDIVTVTTAEQLANVAKNVAAGTQYKGITISLANDIDLSKVCGGDLGDWSPIGTKTYPFLGSFEGNYHTVKNISIENATSQYQGLFGYVGSNGKASSQRIGDFTITGIVKATNSYVGAAAGYFYGGTGDATAFRIENVRNEATVSGISCVGGIVGQINYAQISGCANTGSVTGTGNLVGGIAGSCDWRVAVSDCYNLGTVSGSNLAGGIAGRVQGSDQTETASAKYVVGCYNAGKVKGSSSKAICTTSKGAERCYYLDSTATGNEGDWATAVADAWLKSAEAPAALGDAFAAYAGSYPQLVWETASKGAPVIGTQPASHEANVGDASPAKMEVSASVWEGFGFSGGKLTYQWWSSTDSAIGGDDDKAIEGATETAYAPSTEAASSLWYYCVATNSWGEGDGAQSASTTSAIASYPVHSGTAAATPTFTTHPQSASYGPLDSPAALTAEAKVEGEGAGTLTYQWYSNTINSELGATAIEGATDPSYTPSLEAGDTYYYCVATNTFEITKTATARSEFAKVSVSDEVVVSTSDDMWKVAALANDADSPMSFEGVTVCLAADIDLGASADKPWAPIKGFKGTFEGGGHAITGMYSTTGGFFDDLLAPSVVRGFTLAGTVDAEAVYDETLEDYVSAVYVGAIADTLSDGAAIENVGNLCDVTATYAAGIAGQTTGTGNRISGCFNSGKVVATNLKADDSNYGSYPYGAGIVVKGASKNAKVSVENCYNSGDVSTTSTDSKVYLFGISYRYADSTNCYNSGTVGSSATSTTSGPTQMYNVTNNGLAKNVYYLDSTATGKNLGTAKSDEGLKSAEMPGLLGSAFAYSEGSYPVLAWQLVSGAPTITAQPQSAAYTMPATAEALKVEAQKPSGHAIGADGALSYQWQSSIDGKAWTDVENETSASYTPPVGYAGTAYYRCIVTNAYGETKAVATSDAATVVVLESAAAKPAFTTQPKDGKYGWGDTADALGVEAGFADGETAQKGDISYQWYSNSVESTEGGTAIEGATESTYIPSTTTAIGDVWYWCVATSSISGVPVSSAASNAAKVTVGPSLEISTAKEFVDFLQSTVQNSTGYTDYTGKVVALTADIDLADVEGKTPSANMLFKGTFDGQDHTISGLRSGPLISSTVSGTNAVFRNFTLDIDVELAPAADAPQGQSTASALMGSTRGTVAFEDVTVSGSMTATFATNTVRTYAQYGSFVGQPSGTVTFTRCANDVDIEVSRPSTLSSSAYAYIGGFVGYVDSGVSYDRCVNRGDVSVSGTWSGCYVGGFTGHDSSNQKYTDCLNEGDVTVERGGASGMSGYSNPTMTRCVNTGSVLCTQAPSASYPLARRMQTSSTGNLYLDSSIPEEAVESAYGAAVTDADLNSQATADSLGFAWKLAGGRLMLAWDDGGGKPSVSTTSPDAEYLQGDSATELSVAATLPVEGLAGHDGALSYQWYRNTTGKARPGSDVKVEGAMGTTCTPDTSLDSNFYYYYCAVTNTFDDGRTAVACSEPIRVHIVTDLVAATPYFTVQPASTCYVKGDTAGAIPFEVEVATDGYDEGQAVGDVTYQWYAAKTIESYQRAEGTAIKGATSASYTPYVGKTGTVYYYCVATNTLEGGTREGKVASAKSTVVKARTWSEADAAPVIETQPVAGQQYTQGDAAQDITVEAHKPDSVADMLGGADDSGSSLHYQWYLMAGDSPSPASDTTVGTDSPSYTPPTSVDPDYYSYYCVVTNQISIPNPRSTETSSITTDPARITVVSTTEAATPEVASSMQGGEYVQGDEGATLSVEVTNPDAVGMGELAYQWYRTQNDTCDPNADEAISGATEATYTVDTAIHRGDWKFYCVATNTFENVKVKSAQSEAASIKIRAHEIATALDMADFAAYVNGGGVTLGHEFVLVDDIDLSEVCGADLGNWVPIGNNSSTYFMGTFDGQGHSIDNLYYRGADTYVGLFGYAVGATIENFTVSGSVYADSSMGGSPSNVGAVVGYIQDLDGVGIVKNVGSYADVSISTSGTSYSIGGIVGYYQGASGSSKGWAGIEGCFNRGSVTDAGSSYSSNACAGGLIGTSNWSVSIRDSYNAGTVVGSNPAGLVGRQSNNASYRVCNYVNCFNWGKVTTSYSTDNTAAMVGTQAVEAFSFSNCHYLADTATYPAIGKTELDGCTSETSAVMTSAAFASAMGSAFKEGDEHPLLAWESEPGQPSIEVQPQGGQHVSKGVEAPVLFVKASLPAGDKIPAKGTLHYQWYKSTTGTIDVANDSKVGTDSEEFTPATDELGTAWYYCVVTDQYQGGSSSVTSVPADFTVTSGTPAAKPAIEGQPEGAAYVQGQAAEALSVKASVSGEGAGELSYQWYRGHRADGVDAEAVAGVTDASFVPTTSEVGTFYYFCKVTNTFETYETASADSSIVEVRVSGTTISSADDLVYIRDMVNNNGVSFEGVGFELACDIDLSGVCGSELGSWEPIGTQSVPFEGSIEGNGHTISGLYLDKAATRASSYVGYQGLFGNVSGSTISSLHVDGKVSVGDGKYVGMLAGYATGSTIRNVECSGSVAGSMYVGGIVGWAQNGTSVEACKNSADVSFDGFSYKSWGTTYWKTGSTAAGVVGYANGSTISDCYNAGKVSGGSHSNTTYAGIVSTANNSSVYRCMNIGSVSAGAPVANSATKADDCCYLAGTSTGLDSTGSVEKEASELASAETLKTLGSDYKAGSAHPLLWWEADEATPAIDVQPADAWAYVGDAAPVVSVKASLPTLGAGASGKLSYQWYNSSDGSIIEGATGDSWSPDPSQIAEHSVHCVVTNTYGDGLTATAATDTVCCNVVSKTAASVPQIVAQPEGIYMDKGGEAVPVSVEAMVEGAGAGQLSYQWYIMEGDEPDSASDARIPGATSSSYAPSTLLPMCQSVYCVVTNTLEGAKSESVASDAATVTVSADWMIYTAEDFIAFRDAVNDSTSSSYNGHVTAFLMNDIDISAYCPEGSAFTPFNLFYGTFDGLGHTITGFHNTSTDTVEHGMFKAVYGTVRNLVVEGSMDGQRSALIYTLGNYGKVLNVGSEIDYDLAAGNYSGGLVGQTYSECTIDSCYWKGTARTSHADYFGGLVGNAQGGTISNCYTEGSMTPINDAQYASKGYGGVVGGVSADGLTLRNCYTIVEIASKQGKNYVGGVVGRSNASYYDYYGPNQIAESNNYYSEGTAQYDAAEKSTRIALANMQTADFAATMGSAYRANPGGTPALKWEKHISIEGGSISPVAAQAYTGEAIEPALEVKTEDGTALVEGTDYTVAYSGNVAAGTAMATVTGTGAYTGTLTTTFKIDKVSISGGKLAVGEKAWYTGSPVDADVCVTVGDKELVEDTDYVVSYLNADGAASATAPTECGTYRVYVEGTGNYAGSLGPATLMVARASLADAEVELTKGYVYTGAGIAADLKASFEGKALAEGTDYAVSYEDAEGKALEGAPVEPGTYKVTISGAGVYDGAKVAGEMTISKTSIEKAVATMAADRAWTGEAVSADPTVTFDGKLLSEGADYTVRYADKDGKALEGAPVDAGTYRVSIAGKGLYGGELAVGEMTISKTSIEKAVATMTAERAWTGSAVEADLVVKLDGKLLTPNVDYSVAYSSESGLALAGAPTDEGTYTVTVKAAGSYTGEVAAGKMTISKASIANAKATMAADRAWTGEAVSADPTVTFDGKLLSEGADYTVRYADKDGKALEGAPVDAGTYRVSIAGKGLYGGELAVGEMTISKTSIEKAVATMTAERAWTGSAVEADLVVKLDGKLLTPNVDYSVAYSSESGLALAGAPTDEGTYTVTVKAAGSYTGEVAAGKMTISKASIAGAVAEMASTHVVYTGKAIAASVVVTLDGKTLSEGTDYTLSYASATGLALAGAPTEPGTYKVTVKGAGLYAGEVYAGEFEIAAQATSFERLAGDGRLDTMAAIDGEAFADGTCSDVVLVSAYGFADALSASALAGLYDCPVVTTDGDALSEQAASEIARMAAEDGIRVHIVGGSAVVSDACAGQAAQLACVNSVERISGSDRAATAVAVANAGAGSWSKTAIVVKGGSFADALSISSYAYASRSPLFMSIGGGIGEATAKAISDGGFEQVVVLGGTGGDDGIRDAAVEALGLPYVRLAGEGRIGTSSEVAKWATGQSNAAVQPEVVLGYDGMAIANAWNYPDALASVSLCGKAGSVLLLADGSDTGLATVTSVVSANRESISAGYVLGGTGAVPQSVQDAADAALKVE